MNVANGRTSNGRFAAGNAGGPGRPRREVERAYVDATIAAVPIDEWGEIVKQAVADAKAGDGVARAWLSKVLGIEGAQKSAGDDEGERELIIRVVKDTDWYGNNAHQLTSNVG